MDEQPLYFQVKEKNDKKIIIECMGAECVMNTPLVSIPINSDVAAAALAGANERDPPTSDLELSHSRDRADRHGHLHSIYRRGKHRRNTHRPDREELRDGWTKATRDKPSSTRRTLKEKRSARVIGDKERDSVVQTPPQPPPPGPPPPGPPPPGPPPAQQAPPAQSAPPPVQPVLRPAQPQPARPEARPAQSAPPPAQPALPAQEQNKKLGQKREQDLDLANALARGAAAGTGDMKVRDHDRQYRNLQDKERNETIQPDGYVPTNQGSDTVYGNYVAPDRHPIHTPNLDMLADVYARHRKQDAQSQEFPRLGPPPRNSHGNFVRTGGKKSRRRKKTMHKATKKRKYIRYRKHRKSSKKRR